MKPTVACAIALAALLPVSCNSEVWEATGPGGGGYFMRIGAGPTGIVIACSDLSGPYRSLDRGKTWEPIGPDRGVTNTHAASVAFHPTDAALIYLGTGNGLFRSRDFGQSFEEVVSGGYFEHIAIAPSNAQIAYAAYHPKYNACSGEVHKTFDGGDTWTRIDTNLPPGHRILKILVVPSDSNSIYLLTGRPRFFDEDECVANRNAFLSEDGGVTYTPLGSDFNNLVADIALDPHDDDGLYLSQDDSAVFHLGYLYKSSNRGTSWTLLDEFGGFIWPDASDPQVIRMISSRVQYPWLPKSGIWESTQGGVAGSWSQKSAVGSWTGGWSSAYWAFNSSSHFGAVSADLSEPDAVWWVGSQFLYASFDGGASVEQVFTNEVGTTGSNQWQSRGVDNVVVVDLAVNEANPSEIYAGFWDLGTWCSLDGGESWLNRNQYEASGGWEGSGGNTFTIETDPARPGVVWSSQGIGHSGPAVLLRSDDTGITWPVAGAGLPATPLIGLSLDRTSPEDNRTLFITAGGDVYGSTDDGATWELRLADGGLRFTAVDRHDGSIVYAGGESGVWRSNAHGAAGTWSEVGLPEMRGTVTGLPSAYQWVGVYDLEPDPSVAGRIYVSVHGDGKGLYRSDDNGGSWSTPRLLDDNHLRVVAVDPNDSNIVYATSSSALNAGGYASDSNGVWRSEDAGQSWLQQNDGLTWPFASTVAFGPAGADLAFIGSPGTGIHRRAVPALSADANSLSASDGGTLQLTLRAGLPHANQPYLLLASVSGTTPGIEVAPGISLPLNSDWLLLLSLQHANSAVFSQTLGVLDSEGMGSATIQVAPGALLPIVGQQLSLAYLTLEPVDFASDPVSALTVP